MAFDRSYFETQYASYERQNPPRKMAFYRRLAEAAAADCANPRILDIGCAFGFFLSTLGSRWERFGIDASEYAITRARERVPDARFAVTTSSELVFSAPFDVITAFDVLEHIPAPGEVLERIAAALRPRAGFLFVVPVYDGLTGPAIRHLDRDPTHLHKRERDFWLETAGARFRIVDWWGICRYLLPGGFYCHLVTRSFRRHTPAIACFARLP
jgi:SAM-dependent methyltransferase